MRRLGSGLLVCLLPLLAGLDIAAIFFPGGTLVPWHPVMVDLDVYRLAGRVALEGGDFYSLPGPLQFLYPPVAAVLAMPLAVLPAAVAQIAWTSAGVLLLVAVLYRYGLRGWRLSLAAAAVTRLVEPVEQSLAYGQLGILLVALVVLDLGPGRRLLPGRPWLPEGVLTGLATALKLTPAIFVLYLLAVRRWRTAAVVSASAAVLTLLGAALLPGPSLDFWSRLARGDTGLGGSIIYYTNQSVLADVVRVLGVNRPATAVGLALSAAVVAVGVWAAARWHRLGRVRFAVALCGVAGLLASPVSWLHHFVWVVPLLVCLLGPELPGEAGPRLPERLVLCGCLFVGWVVVARFLRLPNGADVELTWAWWQHLLASVTVGIGVGFLVAAGALARSPGPAVREPAQPPARPPAEAPGSGTGRDAERPAAHPVPDQETTAAS